MPSRPRSVFGLRLRFARKRAGLPQDRLGVLIGLDEGSSSARISRYESGVHEPPHKVAEKIAAALGVPSAYFYCADDDLADLLLELSAMSKVERAAIRKSIHSRKRRAKGS